MERETIVLDTSVLIDYFRKSNKMNSLLFRLSEKDWNYSISILTHYEIYCGTNNDQIKYWNDLLVGYKVLPFAIKESLQAIEIFKNLRLRNKLIELPDIFIAATAIANNLKLATLNKKHFERIEGLNIHNFK